MRAIWNVQASDPGFRAEGVLTLRTALPLPKYAETARRDRVLLAGARPGRGPARRVQRGLHQLPADGDGRRHLAGRRSTATSRSGSKATPPACASSRPGFFATMGIPIRAGRDVSNADTRRRPTVAVVSESFVRRFWPGRMRSAGTSSWRSPTGWSSASSATCAYAASSARASRRSTCHTDRCPTAR